jgi:hypothetical protein
MTGGQFAGVVLSLQNEQQPLATQKMVQIIFSDLAILSTEMLQGSTS